jgi:hypothetical protein
MPPSFVETMVNVNYLDATQLPLLFRRNLNSDGQAGEDQRARTGDSVRVVTREATTVANRQAFGLTNGKVRRIC